MSSSDPARASHPERTLGLPASLAIGVGTMVGAGVFVFPGIAGGRAGPAAVLSFVLGGAVAMLVAGCTAELATAMPATGGAYHYVSRTFGPLAGLLVGVAQCVGLVFAGAFYLIAFGRYARELLAKTGLPFELSPVLYALAAGVVLVVVNLLGSASSGKLQTTVVATLTAALTLLFAYGLLEVTGLTGSEGHARGSFAPNGVLPIFGTAALVFTSYLGFVQIATVAGEIRRPGRTLPLALLGSVALVTLLYALVLFVTTSLFPAERLTTLAESAVVEVARLLIGPAGWFVVLSAGLLATLSSANASILSSSRALQALARDRLAPSPIARIHVRFKVPHLALIAVGLPICGLLFLGRLEILAEVASALHLLIYAFICCTLWYARRYRADDHEPTFRLPAGRAFAGTGLLACLGLLAWMEPLALLIGAGVLVAAILWYLTYARGRYRERADDTGWPGS